MFVSEYLKLDNELEELGVFDSILNEDSHFFINIVRLKSTKTPEFQNSYERINSFFSQIATLLETSKEKGDRFYREALKKFEFSELNEINLGFSKSKHGSGFGPKLRKQVIDDAFDIVKGGSTQPEIFQLVGLFEKNIGPDRLSDMIATIIRSDIVSYTKRINQHLKINSKINSELILNDGLLLNPYKRCNIFLLPVEILHELPIAECWDDIDRVVNENENIRREINLAVGMEWYKLTSSAKKEYLKNHIFKDPKKCAQIIESYLQSEVSEFNVKDDVNYFVSTLIREMRKLDIFSREKHPDTAFEAANEILSIFKDWVENNRGWDIILDKESSKREKIIQRIIHLTAKSYIETNNLDISFEPDAGRGPVDFKVSRGNDITIVEVKLSSNDQYLHGYDVQIEEYAKAEKTNQSIYVFVDIGHPKKREKIREKYEFCIKNNESPPKLFIIDSTRKMSASVTVRKKPYD